ncbi:hypothetical protein CWE22_05655 [Pseudidiomarina aestuarii]|uniref:Glycosyl transferase family 1 domain-containing protein n=1 Tax=Pseudidiomarina aestuarii TaxID=624146 RepID=A0A7Z6ZUV9_9GAMM|nr:glycosyltransferase family 4 protein [Pseudidiomarina aestuarii]RUO41641.1 hypothetical protein CWE22_05655 [Pseudidiomarina aestuarii]
MLHIVATAVKHGRGGISTALVGFTESAQLQAHGFHVIESHRAGNKLRAFLPAVRQIRQSVHPGDDVWLHCGPWFSLLRKYLLAVVARRRGANVYFQFHSHTLRDYLQKSWSRVLIKLMTRKATGVIVLTPWWQDLVNQYLANHVPVYVVPNPLEPQWLKLAAAPQLPSSSGETVSILSMTRLVAGKGVDHVIRAMVYLPEHFHLKIAGEGPEQASLQKLVTELELAHRVEFLGWIDYEQKEAVLRSCQLFCLPSQFDSFGMGFIEAMAAGLPVIALNHEATPDVVKHNETGILVDELSPTALAAAITECYDRRLELGGTAKQYVRTTFDPNVIVTHFINNVLRATAR